MNLTERLQFMLGRVEKIVGTGENAGYQHFLFFLPCSHKVSFSGLFTLFQMTNFIFSQTERVFREQFQIL